MHNCKGLTSTYNQDIEINPGKYFIKIELYYSKRENKCYRGWCLRVERACMVVG